jgi:DNA-binding response OmpR family regulator
MVFDTENFVLRYASGEKQNLTKKEAKILQLLVQHTNKVLPRDIVLNSVWGQDDYFVGRSLDVFITKLRKYLKEDEKVTITNIHGVGFKLTVE